MPETSIPDLLDQGLALHRAGELAAAGEVYRRILAREPNHADAWHLLGLTAHQSGDSAKAIQAIERAVALSPGAVLYQNSLGVALLGAGRFEEGEARLRAALALDATHADVSLNLADALQRQGQTAEAVAQLRAALDAVPNDARLHNALGLALQQQGDYVGAVHHFRRSVECAPGSSDAWNNLGHLLQLSGDLAAARGCYEVALAAKPDDRAARNNLGILLRDSGRFADAEACFRAVLDAEPRALETLNNLGMLLREWGRLAEASALFEQALAIDAGYEPAHRNLLTTLLYRADVTPDALWTAHQRFAQACAPQVAAAARTETDPERRLRVGWLSSDLRWHPVARNILPLLQCHDTLRFEHVLYADVPRPDALSRQLAQYARWQPIVGWSDARIAQQIRADAIDILILLAGHFDRNRLLVAAHRPAPVQISFHDAATSGLDAIDYLIGDAVLTPRKGTERFSERVLRLPVFYLHPPLDAAPAVSAPPCASGAAVTFANFGNPAKINEATIALWAAVLHRLPDARLLLKYRQLYQDEAVRGRIEAAFGRVGIPAQRLAWHGANADHGAHLASYADADIMLDTFPFNGSTTTFEALWMGLPVLTRLGTTMASRWSAAMLAALKRGEWVATSDAAFVETAVTLARDRSALAATRGVLRAQVARSALCDGRGRTRHLERLLRAVWRRHCRTQP